MLNLNQLATQIPGLSSHLNQETEKSRQRLELAQKLMKQAELQQTELVSKQQNWRDRIIFACGEPIEPLNTRGVISVAPVTHTVIATDGSQIAPSHHEIAYCYLINVGRVILHYGQNIHPLLDSIPEVFYQPEDLYVSRQWGIRTDEWMGYRRTVSEANILAELGHSLAQEELKIPTIAMVDGSLIYWFLDNLGSEVRERILPPILAAWEQMRLDRIPLVGYISASRSVESLSFLRLQACPYPEPDCITNCPKKDEQYSDRAPCQIFEPLRDSTLWGYLLAPGQRSPWWKSSARILEFYGNEHTIYFCYINVGAEIARIEVPAWVITDATMLDTVLSLTIAQVQKGYGYPVVLAEAHNQALVTGSDRTRFFTLLEREMIKAGITNVGTSYKEARKRGSIA